MSWGTESRDLDKTYLIRTDGEYEKGSIPLLLILNSSPRISQR